MSSDPRRLADLVSAQEAIAAAGLDVAGVLAAIAAHARALTGAAASTVELLDEQGSVTRTAADGPATEGRTALSAPVCAGGSALAAITLSASATRGFEPADEEALAALARFAAHPLTVAGHLARAERASRTDALNGLGNRPALAEGLAPEGGAPRSTSPATSATAAASRCAWSTSTTSRRSTTCMATRPETASWSR